MEYNRCEESRLNTVDAKSEEVLFDVEKSSSLEPTVVESMKIDEKQSTENEFASPTPQKTAQPPRSKNRGNALPEKAIHQVCEDFHDDNDAIYSSDEDTTNNNNNLAFASKISDSSPRAVSKLHKHERDCRDKLPDKYKIIVDLFDRMVTSVRLLSLRGKLPSFQNICIQVEILTKRKFLHQHLAQMKHILPEVIQIDKILTHDERSLCMKQDMKITLLECDLEGHPNEPGSMTLRRVFHERLLDFFKTHPKGGDIPESLLPEPFNQRNDDKQLESLPLGSSSVLPEPPPLAEFESILNSSLLCPSFSRQFSQKIVPETEKTPLLESPVPFLSVTTTAKSHSHTESAIKNENVSPASANILSPTRPKITPDNCRNPDFSESTPSRPAHFSTPIKLTETPAQPTPKRLMPSPDGDVKVESRMSSCLAPKRALIFSSTQEIDENDAKMDVLVTENDQDKYDAGIQIVMPREIDAMGETTKSSPGGKLVQSGTGLFKRQQMLACLPGLYNMIHLIFQSVNGSSITKQELIHKIIWQSVDTVETEEVEEQLEMLEELVPDWIHRKIVSSGDFLYCVRKASDPNSVLAQLVKAT